MRLLQFYSITLALLLASCQSLTPPSKAIAKPVVADDYLDLIITYSIYAKTIWHPADAGGYWGPGISEPNGNGAVRGMANTAAGYAFLALAMDNQWLSDDQRAQLTEAKLSRDELIRYVTQNLEHLSAHHKSTPDALQPTWGFSWQSSMWTGAWGCAALLIWKDLPQPLKKDLSRIAATEADRIASKPPKDARPGDTGAEENGWDTHAPAIALAMSPNHPRATQWMRALKTYAANTYSTKADQTSTARVGSHLVKDIVTTANLFDDFTLDNHGFFHPDYVQVSGQELGEAWLYVQLGDRINRTNLASEFKPYALHHAKEVWENAAKPLILPTGEFTFPNGTDWTVNASITPSYYAYIATGIGDPIAVDALQRLPRQALKRRDQSPPGRILGDSNLEWWWEPILIKRSTTALLQLALRANTLPPLPLSRYSGRGQGEGSSPTTKTTTSPTPSLATLNLSKLLPNSKVFLFRNENYFASLAWGKRSMATFTPFKSVARNPYVTLPIDPGIVPANLESLLEHGTLNNVEICVVESTNNRRTALVCLPNSAVFLSADAPRPLGLENDSLSGPRTVSFDETSQTIPVLQPIAPFTITSSSVNIDNHLALISTPHGFQYTHAGDFNRKSAAIDMIVPLSNYTAWQMTPGVKADETWRLAHAFVCNFDGSSITVTLQDTPKGHRYRIRANLAGSISQNAGPSVLVDKLD